MVQALFEICKSAARKQKSDLAGDGGPQRFFQGSADKVYYALGRLERDVAHKTVGDDHIHFPAVNISSFNIADEIQRKLFQKLEGFAGKFVALAFFFSNRKQAKPGSFSAEHAANVDVSHDCELLEVVGLTIVISVYVDYKPHN